MGMKVLHQHKQTITITITISVTLPRHQIHYWETAAEACGRDTDARTDVGSSPHSPVSVSPSGCSHGMNEGTPCQGNCPEAHCGGVTLSSFVSAICICICVCDLDKLIL